MIWEKSRLTNRWNPQVDVGSFRGDNRVGYPEKSGKHVWDMGKGRSSRAKDIEAGTKENFILEEGPYGVRTRCIPQDRYNII